MEGFNSIQDEELQGTLTPTRLFRADKITGSPQLIPTLRLGFLVSTGHQRMRLWNPERCREERRWLPWLPSVTTTMITENPSAEVCNIQHPQGKLGRVAISQPKFPEVLTNYTPQKTCALHLAKAHYIRAKSTWEGLLPRLQLGE